MKAGMNLVRSYIIPFFDAGYGYLIVVYTYTIHPFFFLRDVIDRDQGFARRFYAVLREIDSGERDVDDLTDNERLAEGDMIIGRKLFGTDIIQPSYTIPVLLRDDGMFQVKLSGLTLDDEFIGLGSGEFCKKTADQYENGHW